MKRADLEKRAQRDKFGSGKHGFQGGNPATGQLPTIPGAEWFDHVQEEIAGVIEGAGLTVNSQNYNQLLQAIRGLMAAGAVPYTGSNKHVDLNGKNLNNVGELKLGDGSNSDYQQVILGNYGRSPGKGNYGAIFNGKQGGDHKRWMAIGTFGEDGNHISGLWADAAKAYLRLGSTNHELAKAADTILAHGGTFTGAVGYNRILSVNNGNDGMPDGAYKYGLGLSLASGNGKAQLYIAHTGGVYARGGYHTHPMQQWYRVDGSDWSDVRGKPNNLAGYGITDAASKAEVAALVTGNLAEQGWTKLPNGLILQWGQADGSNRANFPIAFNQCFSCAVMETNTNDTWNYAFAHDNTSIWVSMRGDKIRGFKYIAIGR